MHPYSRFCNLNRSRNRLLLASQGYYNSGIEYLLGDLFPVIKSETVYLDYEENEVLIAIGKVYLPLWYLAHHLLLVD